MTNITTKLQALRLEKGLSQEDMAFLLGGTTGGMVCRHEKGNRIPDLETAIAYALIHGMEIQTLFNTLEEKAREQIERRAAQLLAAIPAGAIDPTAVRRRQMLKELSMPYHQVREPALTSAMPGTSRAPQGKSGQLG